MCVGCMNDAERVAGAGVGGVATAARLAKAGYRVTVVEKNGFTGGRCSLIHDNGYVRAPPLCLRLCGDS
jgi:heterodisulfide reductase subunit A-like polyferredoxin